MIRAPDGQPVAGARVFFVSGPGPFPDIAALTDDQGRFALSARLPGTYQIECVAEGFASTRETIAALSGQQVAIEISLKRA